MSSAHDYTVCDGHCAPDECVCPSAEQRCAEIHAAVDAERTRIERIIEVWAENPKAGDVADLLTSIRGDDR
jgi:hypothetical protein